MIAAMVLGIISLIIPYVGILLAVAGIILAAMALNEIKEFGDQGRGMALAGLICAIISLPSTILVVNFFFFKQKTAYELHR